MKRQHIYITVLIYCLFFIDRQSLYAQDRGAVWVHGFGSNSGEWANWANTFTGQRQLQTQSNGSFDSNNGVGNMAGQVMGSYGNNNDAQRIYFGHSMGGVVGRHIDVNANGQFGGIITAGAPFDGARIANTAFNGELVNCVNDGIWRVLRGISAQSGIFTYAILGITVNSLPPYFQTVVNQQLGNNQTVNDLQENSGYINGVRNNNTNTPKVSIYGDENAPVSWRIATTLTGTDVVSVVNTAGDVYETMMWVNIGLAAATGWWTFGIGAAYFGWVAYEWSVGTDWWRYGSEGNWNYLIGASTPSSNTVCYDQMNWDGFNQCMINAGTSSAYTSCQQQNTYQVCYTYYSNVNGLSDGFIKASSQSGYNSGWANNSTRIEAQGVNHLEMGTHERMGQIYNDIFNGFGVDGFFSTPTR
jgi:pimeloyl-ACP methyl ester carboxylesterase